jgi:hypothetical protein
VRTPDEMEEADEQSYVELRRSGAFFEFSGKGTTQRRRRIKRIVRVGPSD